MEPGKVMIVDNNLENRLVASGFLEDDYKLLAVESGEKCLHHLPLFKPDIILLDWMMTPIDGIETIRLIKERFPEFRNVRIIMLTAKAQPEDIVTAWRAGAHDYIVKPFEMEEILKITENQLNEKRRHDRLDQEQIELKEHMQQTQKMEAIGVLAGGIAHDFNNILFPIIGYSELTLELDEATEEIKDNINEIRKAAVRAQNLVKQILAFSRQGNMKQQGVEVGLIIKEALKLLRPAFPANIEFRTNIPVSSGIILADPTQIHQIIMNLCTNAKHAMEKGGGILTISMENILTKATPEYAALKPDTEYLRLTVGDTGEGIKQEIMEKIFEPFFTTKEVGKGTGMGLSVVHGILKNLGGAISVESREKEGSRFDVYFPIAADEKNEHKNAAISISGGAETIFVVDDETVIAEMLTRMLSDLGYLVRTFNSCSDAIEAMDSMEPDLILTDMSMPGMSGLDLVKYLSNRGDNFPVILMTGFSEVVTRESALEHGVKDFLLKPIVRSDLAQAIRKVLDSNG